MKNMTKEQEFVKAFLELVDEYKVTAISTEPFSYGRDMVVSLCVGDKIVVDYHVIENQWTSNIDL